jgi:hypothetical protein
MFSAKIVDSKYQYYYNMTIIPDIDMMKRGVETSYKTIVVVGIVSSI